MQLSIQSMKLTDFMAFAGKHEIDFTAATPGLHFVRGRNDAEPSLGSNGAAKSTLWHALTWCLFGRTVEGLRNPDVRSWFGKKASRVSVRLLIDGKRRRVTRRTHPNRLELQGKETSQEKVERLIGLSFEMFTATLFLAQEQPLFMDLSPANMLQIFSDALGLHKWEERSERAGKRAQELEASAATKERRVISCAARVAAAKEQLAAARRRRDAWEAEVNEEKGALLAEQKELTVKISGMGRKITDAELQEDWQGAELMLQKKAFEDLYADLFKLRDALSDAKARRDVGEDTLAKLRKELAEVEETTVCPTCGQPLDDTDMGHELAAHKKKLRKRITVLSDEIVKLNVRKRRREYAKKEETIEAERARLNTLESSVRQLQGDLRLWRRNMLEAETRLGAVDARMAELEGQTNPYKREVREARKARDEWVNKREHHENAQRRLLRQVDRTRFWVKGFKDLRLHILEEVLQELQFVANSQLEEMGLVGWEIGFSIERETKAGTTRRGINVMVQAPSHKEAVKWRAWSGGERQRLRLAGSLALSEVLLNHAGVTPDFEILDEPTRSLSEEGVDDLCTFLAERARQLGRKIWYTDHHVMDGQLFASTLLVVKNEAGASIIGG